MYPSDCLYTKEHEWLKVEDGQCTLGITTFAQHQLGEIVFAELPEVGQSFDARDEIGTLESVKAVAEVYTPVAGEIIEINDSVIDDPEVLNDDPQGAGWLVKIKLSGSVDEGDLMDAAAYQEYIGGGDDGK
ncbi:MAG: glycine cleavage system protein GcvH [Acidobacteria bacterium]|nr:glycine cleavage system protein GcvH [Acidobacteriota bacterium]